MKYKLSAIIKKDLKKVLSSKTMFISLLAVPLVLTVLLPTIFILSQYFLPQENDEFAKLLELLPLSELSGSLQENITKLILNYALPIFFLLIPIMASTIMSAASFVGEKEKQTLETLLYCPLSLKQLFQAKTAASFLLSMSVSSRYAYRTRNGNLLHRRHFYPARYPMAACYAAACSVAVCNCNHTYGTYFCKSTKCGRCSAGCCFLSTADFIPLHQPVCRFIFNQCLDIAWFGNLMCCFGLPIVSTGCRKFYL